MNGYRDLTRCGESGKACHTRSIARFMARRARRRFAEPYGEYHCRDCGWWHWGHSIGLRRLIPVRR